MDKFKFIMSSMWGFLWPFIKVLLTSGGQLLATSAMSAVAEAHGSGLSSSEKRDMAIDLIKRDLKAGGVTIATSVINAALEAAVVKLKEV